jgi:hypothetical protein
VHVIFPDGTECAIDVGTTHHLLAGETSRNLNWFRELLGRRVALEARGLSDIADEAPSPAVLKIVAAKSKKYRPLFDLMAAQAFTGKRRGVPEWMACIVSNACEFSPAVFTLIERLSALIKARYSQPNRPLDGFTPSAAAADFRTRFKDEIASTVGSGFATMLQASAAASG